MNPWVGLSHQAKEYDQLSQGDSTPIVDRAIGKSSTKIDTIHNVISLSYVMPAISINKMRMYEYVTMGGISPGLVALS